MLHFLSATMVISWFWIAHLVIKPRENIPLIGGALLIPTILIIGHEFLPYMFLVKRKSGVAFINEGLSLSNALTRASTPAA